MVDLNIEEELPTPVSTVSAQLPVMLPWLWAPTPVSTSSPAMVIGYDSSINGCIGSGMYDRMSSPCSGASPDIILILENERLPMEEVMVSEMLR